VQHTVLVVDDDQDIRESLRAVLEEEGYCVRTAADGVEAVATMEAEPPCFVILDLMMPVMDGWEVAGRMHDEERLAAIPVCVVTATPEWAPADSTCVLPKPIDVRRLLAVLHAHCPE
jgi:two-component system chemotaxis response regulator CheY